MMRGEKGNKYTSTERDALGREGNRGWFEEASGRGETDETGRRRAIFTGFIRLAYGVPVDIASDRVIEDGGNGNVLYNAAHAYLSCNFEEYDRLLNKNAR